MKKELLSEVNRMKEMMGLEPSENVIEEQWSKLVGKLFGLSDNIAKDVKFANKIKSSFKSKMGELNSDLKTIIKNIEDGVPNAHLKIMEIPAAKKQFFEILQNDFPDLYDDIKQLTYNNKMTKLVNSGQVSLDLLNKGDIDNWVRQYAKNDPQNTGFYRKYAEDYVNKNKVTPEAPKPKIEPEEPVVSRTQPKTFTIPEIKDEISTVITLDEVAAKARLKLKFPKAPQKDIDNMVKNLKLSQPNTQEEFNQIFLDAVRGYESEYQTIINSPTLKQKLFNTYNELGKWGKRAFWFFMIPTTYFGLKAIGVPVDKLAGWGVSAWKDITKEQGQGVKDALKPGETKEPPANQPKPKANW